MERDDIKVSLILLAGGKGLRVGCKIPKQFIVFDGTSIAEYALKPFLDHPGISECVIVCAEAYRHFFKKCENILFADPGDTRLGSLQNGLDALSYENSLVFVHDAARPFFDPKYIDILLKSALECGAAVMGVPSSSTLKEVDSNGRITKTLDRSSIWEAQTPQVAFKKILLKGIERAEEEKVQVTDEASLMELLGSPVKMVQGNPSNFKVTLPGDLTLAKAMTLQNDTYDEKIFDTNCI